MAKSVVEVRMAYVEYSNPPLVGFEPTLTVQSFKDECDYNLILERYERTQVLEHVNSASPQYLDVSEVADYQTALEIVRSAESSFMDLPARTRSRFDNDPRAFVDFCLNPANRDEAIELGLIDPVVADSPAPTPVSDSPKPA